MPVNKERIATTQCSISSLSTDTFPISDPVKDCSGEVDPSSADKFTPDLTNRSMDPLSIEPSENHYMNRFGGSIKSLYVPVSSPHPGLVYLC